MIAALYITCCLALIHGSHAHCSQDSYFDCQCYQDIGHTTSTVYQVTPIGMHSALSVFCDFDEEGEGWIIIQRSVDDSVDFNRTWDDYEKGFGDIRGNYWIGLLPLWRLTMQGHYQLRITIKDWDNTTIYATYDYFKIGSPEDMYTLQALAFSSTTADCMSSLRGLNFSTKDKDNDNWPEGECALFRGGGWWHNHCGGSSLNGQYFSYEERNNSGGIRWNMTSGYHYSYKFSEMKIKRG